MVSSPVRCLLVNAAAASNYIEGLSIIVLGECDTFPSRIQNALCPRPLSCCHTNPRTPTKHTTNMGAAISSCFRGPKATVKNLRTTHQPRSASPMPPSSQAVDAYRSYGNELLSVNNRAPFRLLDLPIELVDRITSYINSEALITVRRTCKALDAITFDRFATENFERVYCWIPTNTDFARLKDTLQRSPRLRGRIRHLKFTTDVLRDRRMGTANALPENWNTNEDARYISTRRHHYGGESCVGVLSVVRILRDISRLPQNVSVGLNLACPLSGYFGHRFESPGQVHHIILFCVAMARTKLLTLQIDKCAFENSDDLLAYNRADLMASMSGLMTFEFKGDMPHRQMHIYREILESAPELHNLAFDGGAYQHGWVSLTPLAAELLLANRLSILRGLKITSAILDEQIIIHALKLCQKSLTHLVLRQVALAEGNDGWEYVIEAMLAMPELLYVELRLISTDHAVPRSAYRVDDDAEMLKTDIFEGRELVTEGLQSLLDYVHM